MTRHSDQIDKANDLAQMFSEQGLEQIRRRNRPEQIKNDDGTWPHEHCVDCGDDIPELRLEMGKIRCVYCQESLERRSNGY